MPGLVPDIEIGNEDEGGRDICAKTRGACHRAALRADPLALLPGHDDVNSFVRYSYSANLG
jgi:hypothetical protein